MYRQVKTPNLDPVIYQGGKILYNWLGWCLAYVQTAFGAGWAGSHAWDGWNRSQGKHYDRNMPRGVYVPIWFDGWWNGGRYGHAAIYKDGIIYSSPYSNKATFDKLGSIEEVERIYGMKFVGWSEFVGPTRVLEYIDHTNQIKSLYREILERDADQGGINHYNEQIRKGWSLDMIRNDLLQSAERRTLLANKEKARQEAERRRIEAEAAAEKAREEAERKKREAEAEARRAEEAAAAIAEKERQQAEEEKRKQAETAPSWSEIVAEQKKTNNLLTTIADILKGLLELVKNIFNR